MSTILVVDAGNTRVKCALVDEGVVLEQWGFLTKAVKRKIGPALRRVDMPIALASVVPTVTDAVTAWCRSHGRSLFVIKSSEQSLVRGPDELGADLVAQAAAALTLYGQGKPVAILGMGTAITLTTISGDGKFQGAWFTLGLKPSRDTLAERCALLHVVGDTLPTSISIGNDTPTCVNNGVLLATVGCARAYAEEAVRLLGKGTRVIATGGDCATVVPLANLGRKRKRIHAVDGELTLKGIYLLYKRSLRR